jgi:hypothetical protein
MTFKSQVPSRHARGEQTSAGAIVFLMMALVFVPIIAIHLAITWHDQISAYAPQQLAAIVNMLLTTF